MFRAIRELFGVEQARMEEKRFKLSEGQLSNLRYWESRKKRLLMEADHADEQIQKILS